MEYLDHEALAVALKLLKAGMVGLGEAAWGSGISARMLSYWCVREGIEWRAARKRWIEAQWLKAEGRRRERTPGKAALRRLAAEANAEHERMLAGCGNGRV